MLNKFSVINNAKFLSFTILIGEEKSTCPYRLLKNSAHLSLSSHLSHISWAPIFGKRKHEPLNGEGNRLSRNSYNSVVCPVTKEGAGRGGERRQREQPGLGYGSMKMPGLFEED